MIEKRRKHHTGEEEFHIDVEEYESKKISFRHRWGYLVVFALMLGAIYLKYRSNQTTTASSMHMVFPIDNEIDRNHLEIASVKSNTYAVKSTPINKEMPKEHLESELDHKTFNELDNNEKSNLRRKAAIDTDSITEEELQAQVDQQIAKIRDMKFNQHIIMETNESAKNEITILQVLLRRLIKMQYGPGPYRIEMKLQFPQSMAQPLLPQEQTIVIDLAPISLVPYSVYYFLEIAKHWKTGAFHRNAGHVLQAQTNTALPKEMRGMAFQEYHPDFPHKQYTLGYAGRPGGPAFYISTVNNVQNHGPGSQGSATEADGCFGRVQAQSIDVIKRMQQQPGAGKPMGFVNNPKNHIKIVALKVLNHKV